MAVGGRWVCLIFSLTNIHRHLCWETYILTKAVKLSSGDLAVFSPVALTPESKAKVASLGGTVRYIVALDYEHHIFLSEWARAYPEAALVGPEGLPEKRASQHAADPSGKIGDEPFAVVFKPEGKHDVRIGPDFDADFDYEYADGHANREVVFYYRPERTLIQADLLFTLPATEQYSRVPEAERPGGGIGRLFEAAQSPSLEGDNTWVKRFAWYLLAKDRESLNDSIARIDGWDFERIVPCHGDVVEGHGKELFRKVFAWHLEAAGRA